MSHLATYPTTPRVSNPVEPKPSREDFPPPRRRPLSRKRLMAKLKNRENFSPNLSLLAPFVRATTDHISFGAREREVKPRRDLRGRKAACVCVCGRWFSLGLWDKPKTAKLNPRFASSPGELVGSAGSSRLDGRSH